METPFPARKCMTGFSKTWTITNAMISTRFQHTATMLPNGQRAGDWGEKANSGNPVRLAEAFDAAAGSWSPARPAVIRAPGRNRNLAVRWASDDRGRSQRPGVPHEFRSL